jgi:hypothetical protein
VSLERPISETSSKEGPIPSSQAVRPETVQPKPDAGPELLSDILRRVLPRREQGEASQAQPETVQKLEQTKPAEGSVAGQTPAVKKGETVPRAEKSESSDMAQEREVAKPAADAKVTELFEIVEQACNNNKARLVAAANGAIAQLNAKMLLPADKFKVVDRLMTAAEIRRGIEGLIAAVEKIGDDKLPGDVKTAIAEIKAGLKQLEADSMVATVIAMARRAKYEDQKLIIGLDTDWIPGYNEDRSLQKNAMTSLVREIESLGDTLRSLGLDNVIVIHKSKDELAPAILSEADRTHTRLSNVVVLGSNEVINSEGFAALRSTADEERAFLAAIDPAELEKYVKAHQRGSEQFNIRLVEMLTLALELAVGKEPPQMPLISSYDKARRMVIFLPKAEPVDYEKLKDIYKAETATLVAA